MPDTTTQTQNVGDGRFYGAEIGADAPVGAHLRVGGNYTVIKRTINDALLPNLRPTGVPAHKAFLYAAWQPIQRLTITPLTEGPTTLKLIDIDVRISPIRDEQGQMVIDIVGLNVADIPVEKQWFRDVSRVRIEDAKRQRFVLSSHVRPDGDAIGSQLAMAFALWQLGKEVRLVNRDQASAAIPRP